MLDKKIPLLHFASRHPHVHIASSLRSGIQSVDHSFALPKDNRPTTHHRQCLQKYINKPIQWLRQVHGTEVIQAVHASCQSLPVADAAYTNTQCALAVVTADCLPVVLYNANEIAVVHAGWRSLAGGLVSKTLACFQASADAICAWFGPAIGHTSYEVGDDMRQAVLAMQPAWETYFTPRTGKKWLYNLTASARYELSQAGVVHIDDCEIDTFTDARFYSYRKEGAQAGRFVTCVWCA